ncbi:MAG TPA: hypothetical protein DCR97_05525 [Deltaproteobacteria bacterium]|nr:hypothetical protein [Deltaproteobacteria bacterium]
MTGDLNRFDMEANDREEAFSAQETERLLRELREKAKAEEKRKGLSAVVKTKGPTLIHRLLEPGVTPESILALGPVPFATIP